MRIKDIFSKNSREPAKTSRLRKDGTIRSPRDGLVAPLTAGVESLSTAGPGIGPTTLGRELPSEEAAVASEIW